MKRFSLFLLSVLVSSVAVMADGYIAILQHGEEVKMFTTNQAFKQAYNAAVDGDVITLSPGTFIYVSTIEKSVRIVGSFGMNNTSSASTIISNNFTVAADDVHIEGIYCAGQITFASGIHNLTIKRCYFNETNASGEHHNTLIDQSIIIFEGATPYGINYSIKNSTIQYFSKMNNASHIANITNCYVDHFFLYNSSYYQPYAIYKNNVLRCHTTASSSYFTLYVSAPSEFHNNYFYFTKNSTSSITSSVNYSPVSINDHNTYTSVIKNEEFPLPNPNSYEQTGGDGTPIGITGGTGFNEWPGIPRVLSAEIDAQTDDKGMLNATFTVKPEK